jgi:hypothetical protein
MLYKSSQHFWLVTFFMKTYRFHSSPCCLCMSPHFTKFCTAIYLLFAKNNISNFMEQIFSWKDNSSSARQKLPWILWNLKVPYNLANNPLFVFTLNQVQSVPSYHIYLRWVLLLSFHLCLSSPISVFTSGVLTKSLYAFVFCTVHDTPISSPWSDPTNNICEHK